VSGRCPGVVEKTALQCGIVWDSPEQANERGGGAKLSQCTDLAQGQAVFNQRSTLCIRLSAPGGKCALRLVELDRRPARTPGPRDPEEILS